ncbi:uncharacterized protein LOC108903853 [Anoplophora glabripennis]|uniref:uncharacterized protein LOC108903853 n=1 Tax=Anoplophora glabripennis TaxID=217634 RepID=UPI0008744390|nr:uncharacterized protein LOC108903853 [Anoplophora glabripennis]
MEAEQASFKNFTKKSGDFFYDVINVEHDKINLEPKSTKVITIGFGLPEVISAKKREEIRKLQERKEKAKGKKDKGDKKAKASKGSKKSGSTKGSKKSNASVKKMPEDQVFYVAKYNIMLNETFLKDIILISTIIG